MNLENKVKDEIDEAESEIALIDVKQRAFRVGTNWPNDEIAFHMEDHSPFDDDIIYNHKKFKYHAKYIEAKKMLDGTDFKAIVIYLMEYDMKKVAKLYSYIFQKCDEDVPLDDLAKKSMRLCFDSLS